MGGKEGGGGEGMEGCIAFHDPPPFQVDLKTIPPLVVNRIMRRQPKAIYRIRKILMSPRRHAQSLDSYSPESSCDSFTVTERNTMLVATMAAQQRSQHYTDDLSIEEFIRDPQRRHESNPPVLQYHHETDSYVKKPTGKKIAARSLSVDSAQKSPNRSARSSFAKDNLSSHSGTPASFKSLDPSSFTQTLGSTGARQEASPREARAVEVVDLPILSDPVINENTGFQGDSQLPFFTPSSSMDEDEECFSGQRNGGVAPQDGRPGNSEQSISKCNGLPKEDTEEDLVCGIASLQTKETFSAPSISVQQSYQ